MATTLHLSHRKIISSDESGMLKARNLPVNRQVSTSTRQVLASEHHEWFSRALQCEGVCASLLLSQAIPLFYFTSSRVAEKNFTVGTFRGVEVLPHPVFGAILPLLAIEVALKDVPAEAITMSVSNKNLPILRSREALGLNSIGHVEESVSFLKQSLTRSEFDACRESIWEAAAKLFGSPVGLIRKSLF